MKSRILLFLLLAVPALIINSCKRHDRIGDSDPVVNDAETVTAGITGIVVNEHNIPLPGITVTSGSNTATTDRYGMFRFSNIPISKKNATVKVVQTGYFTAYRTFPAKAGIIHNVRIKLIPKINAGAISASAGGTVNITGGGKVVIPASAVTDAGGNAYSGTVNVAMTWIDPTSPQLNSIMMGDLRGVTAGGQERVLETYGMLGVELTGSGGQPLKIAPGKTAELTFPIPASLQSGAPATIPLWHFDEATSRWKEEGTATKSGSNYTGNVSHFSFWNCDAPWPQINLCMQLVNNGKPLGNVSVRIRRLNVPSSVAVGLSDSLGNICGIVPKDEPLTMEVLDGCGNVVYTQNIGPFSSDASLGIFNVSIPGNYLSTITGTAITCNSTLVTNGSVFIVLTNGTYFWGNITNGRFSIPVINCSGNAISFSALATDNDAHVQGNAVNGSGSGSTIDIGVLTACGVSTQEFVNMQIEGGTTYNWAPPLDTFIAVLVSSIQAPFTLGNFFNCYHTDNNSFVYQTNFVLHHNGVPGAGILNGCEVTIPSAQLFTQILVAPAPVNFTEFGPRGSGFIAGNFIATMRFAGQNKLVSCSFRFRRP